ncbi:MAG TPA: Uxx-star family glutaredoxin-like (seleno)protein [archaeon]|nr:Uxx-star family glutaredoxin-like (seleno)protein [archaeon]
MMIIMSVKIYTTNHCPYCVMAKEFFKKNDVAYTEINVEEDEAAAEEMIEKSGQMGVPVIDVNGEIIVGFNRSAIEKALKAKK